MYTTTPAYFGRDSFVRLTAKGSFRKQHNLVGYKLGKLGGSAVSFSLPGPTFQWTDAIIASLRDSGPFFALQTSG